MHGTTNLKFIGAFVQIMLRHKPQFKPHQFQTGQTKTLCDVSRKKRRL